MAEETRVVVEGWNRLTGWHFGGYYDLKDPEQEAQAREMACYLSRKYSPVRCRRLYHGGEVNLFAPKERES